MFLMWLIILPILLHNVWIWDLLARLIIFFIDCITSWNVVNMNVIFILYSLLWNISMYIQTHAFAWGPGNECKQVQTYFLSG